MGLNPAAKLSAANSAPGSAVHGNENENDARHAKLKQLRTAFRLALTIAVRKPAAALTESNAVTGPCTAEYGPCIAGKKKIASTLITAIPASIPAIRPELMNVNYTVSMRVFQRMIAPART
jgi:hypothetical protein